MKLKMNFKHTITILCLLALLAAPAAAADSTAYEHTKLTSHPQGYTIADIRDKIADIISDTSLSSIEKIEAQAAAAGYDNRLNAWLHTPRDSETGEIQYGTYIPVISPILKFLGLSTTESEPYTEEEGRAAWDEFHRVALETYQPSGTFPGAGT